MTRISAIICGLAILLAGCSSGSNQDATYYLVRHAEKVKESSDPALTAEGKVRALRLSERLSEVPVSAVYSTDYRRTRATAAPTADAQGVSITIYDPRDLEAVAKRLKKKSGHILIVGHSNTTPQLVDLLGGDGGEPIDEASEYDRLYILLRQDDGVTEVLERYGARYTPVTTP